MSSVAYTRAVAYRRVILQAFAESTQYLCKPELSVKTCKKAATTFDTVNITELSLEEALDLGFVGYHGLYLIPLWLLPAINKGTKVTSISGDVVNIFEADDENRRGLMVYGLPAESFK